MKALTLQERMIDVAPVAVDCPYGRGGLRGAYMAGYESALLGRVRGSNPWEREAGGRIEALAEAWEQGWEEAMGLRAAERERFRGRGTTEKVGEVGAGEALERADLVQRSMR